MKLGPVSSGVLNIMRDFAPWTSTHAVPHIFMADTLIIAIFWSIAFFGALGLAIWQFYTVIAKYLSFPIQLDARVSSGDFWELIVDFRSSPEFSLFRRSLFAAQIRGS
jgi:hypothetical protein